MYVPSVTRDGRKRRGMKTRVRIVKASIAVVARDGLAGLTGAALAAEAEVSKAAVFHHFPSLDLVPLATLDYIVENLVGAVQHHATAREYLLHAGLDVLRLTAEEADEALAMNALLTGAGHSDALRERMAEVSAMYRDAMAVQIIQRVPHAEPERAREIADIAIPAVDGLATHLLLTGERERLERAWGRLVDSLLLLIQEPSTTGNVT